MDCHTLSPKTSNLLHWVDIVPQKTPCQKPGEFPKAEGETKGQMVQYGLKYIQYTNTSTNTSTPLQTLQKQICSNNLPITVLESLNYWLLSWTLDGLETAD